MLAMANDWTYAWRGLRRTPGFTAVAVLIVALGIGTVTAVFTVLDRAVLRPLPIESPERWTRVGVARGKNGDVNSNLSYPLFADVRNATGAFDAAFAHAPASLTIGFQGDVERVEAAAVTGGFFTALGVPLLLGRDIRPDEDRVGAAQSVVVLSYGLWQRRFGGDRSVIGSDATLNGTRFTIVGVAPRSFFGVVRGMAEEAWIPLSGSTSAGGPDVFQRRNISWLDVMGRLAPGNDRTRALAPLAVLQHRLVSDSLLGPDNQFVLEDGSAGFTWLVGELQRPLTVLLGASLLVLAVACANLAGLFFARAAARRREMAIRLSLGASRSAVTRLFLCEGVIIGVLGSLGGLLLAAWLNATSPTLHTLFGAPLELSGGLDGRTLVVVLSLALVTALGMALGPALWSAGLQPLRGLREATTVGDTRGHTRANLVVLQLGLAVVLVTGALLLGVTTRRLAAVDPGYDPADVMVAGVDLAGQGYGRVKAAQFWGELAERLDASPGVLATSVTQTVTPSPGGMNWTEIRLEGSAVPLADVTFDMNLAGPGYFTALRIPIIAGRGFTTGDRIETPPVAIINQAMARRYWGEASPLGRHLYLDGDSASAGTEVVGIVPDGKYRSLREAPLPMAYLPSLQSPPITGWLLVRAQPGQASTLPPLVRQAVRDIDPGLAVFDIRPLAEHLSLAHGTERLLAFLAAVYGTIATILAAVGLFGLLSYTVTRCTREIGIRVALGAEPAAIRKQFAGQGLRRAAFGVALGIGLTAIAGRLLRSLLFEVEPLDPLVLLGVSSVMLAVAVLASWWPAVRASRVDPMVALRSE